MTNLTHNASNVINALGAVSSGKTDDEQLKHVLSVLSPIIQSDLGKAILRLFTDTSLIQEDGSINTSAVDSILSTAITPPPLQSSVILVCPNCRTRIITES